MGCLVVLLAGMAALLGVFWQLALGVVLPNRGMDDDQVAAMEALVADDWTGYLTCGRDRRGVRVDFERRATKRYDVSAAVTVHRGPRPGGKVRDEYDLEGTFDGSRLTITGDDWSSGNPDRLDLDGTVKGKEDEDTSRIVGTTANQVPRSGCTGTFRLQRSEVE